MKGIWKLFIPRFPVKELPRMLGLTFLGAIAGGIYGIFHDQITYTISPEYYTCLKFNQFAYARPALDSPRLFAGIIGFLASWWVGGLVAWVLSRVCLLRENRIAPFQEMVKCFSLVFVTSMLSATIGFCWGLWRERTGYDIGWIDLMDSLGVKDRVAFMKVAYIHNASYLGGISGTVMSLFLLKHFRDQRRTAE